MSRKMQSITLSLIVGVSVLLGALVGSTINQGPIAAEAASSQGLVGSVMKTALPMGQAVVAPSFADIAERANPAIVAIQSTEFKKRSRRPEGFDPFEYFFWPDGPRGRAPQDEGEGDPDEEERKEGAGSGFIIKKDGYILTNFHVVNGASRLTVTLDNGEKYPATVKGKDESIDLALIKIEVPRDLPVLPLGDSSRLRTGEWVIAIGNPLGYEHSVTVGVVSGKGRPLRDLNPEVGRGLANYIQTDAAINFGNSGGPLLNAQGEVVGINTAITRSYPGYQSGVIQGIGFALPIDHAKSVLDQLITTGRVARGYLNIQIQPIAEKEQKYYGLSSRKGALVQKVNEDGPAARAGMEDGDIIVAVDGKTIDGTEDLIQMISSHRPGEAVNLGILRDGKNVSLKVKLADRSETFRASARGNQDEEESEEAKPETAAKLGFSPSEINASLFREIYAGQFDLPKNHPDGVLVKKVSNQGPAYEAGLTAGNIITHVGRTPVASVSDFNRATAKIQKGQVVRLTVVYYSRTGLGDAFSQESRFAFIEAE